MVSPERGHDQAKPVGGCIRSVQHPSIWKLPCQFSKPRRFGAVRRAGHRLSFDERIEIMRGLGSGVSQAEIARRIGRDRSVVCREIKRKRLPDGDYHARMAHAYATDKTCRPQDFKLKDNPLCARSSPLADASPTANRHPNGRQRGDPVWLLATHLSHCGVSYRGRNST